MNASQKTELLRVMRIFIISKHEGRVSQLTADTLSAIDMTV